jgi:hypothetical protein
VPLVTRQVLRRFRTGDIAKAVVSVGRADAYPASAAAAIANGENSLAAQCQPYVGAANVARELQVYKADLRFVAHLQGFRCVLPYCLLFAPAVLDSSCPD